MWLQAQTQAEIAATQDSTSRTKSRSLLVLPRLLRDSGKALSPKWLQHSEHYSRDLSRVLLLVQAQHVAFFQPGLTEIMVGLLSVWSEKHQPIN